MFRNAVLGLSVLVGLGLTTPQQVTAQAVRRADAPEISVLYWYNKTDPQGTIKFQVYEGAYPQGPVRDWMKENKINDVNSNLRGCPFNAPFRVQLSRYPGYQKGTMTKEDIVQVVEEQIKKTLPAPQSSIEIIKPVVVDPHPSEQPNGKAERKGFAYDKDAAKQVGSLAGTKWIRPDNVNEFEFTRNKMNRYHLDHFGPKYSDTAATNQKLFDLPELYKNRPDGGSNWMGLWHQVGNKVYLYDEIVTGRLEHVGTGTLHEGKIVFEPHKYSDGSVSEPETWTQKK